MTGVRLAAPSRRPERGSAGNPAMSHDAERLITLVQGCAAAGVERRCLVLRLSGLPPDFARPHHLRLAREALGPLLAADRAQVFRLPNHDIAVVWRGSAQAALDTASRAVCRLFADGPDGLPDVAALCLTLDLPSDTDRLLTLARASIAAPESAANRPAEAATPLDPAALTRLESVLARADMARFARRTQVWAVSDAGVFDVAWERRTLSMDELSSELAPQRDVRADPWLFARLTRTLDRRMLALLADPNEVRGAGPFGLDLNVSSILAPEFLRFDAALPHGLRGQVTLGLLPGDILADLSVFLFARDFARSRGYRLLLRMATPDMLSVLPLDRMGLDLLGLGWSNVLPALDRSRLSGVARRVVLTGAHSAEAVAWGRVHGVKLFAGRAAMLGRVVPDVVLAES